MTCKYSEVPLIRPAMMLAESGLYLNSEQVSSMEHKFTLKKMYFGKRNERS